MHISPALLATYFVTKNKDLHFQKDNITRFYLLSLTLDILSPIKTDNSLISGLSSLKMIDYYGRDDDDDNEDTNVE